MCYLRVLACVARDRACGSGGREKYNRVTQQLYVGQQIRFLLRRQLDIGRIKAQPDNTYG